MIRSGHEWSCVVMRTHEVVMRAHEVVMPLSIYEGRCHELAWVGVRCHG